MYILIKAHLASKYELETCYTLSEALKLFALYERDNDIKEWMMENSLGGEN